ncbi:MAG TPA: hypothetical protein VFR34_05840, partial [Paracoccaceae bacterium]|nr:hypothetical protein [Paracoccaceae bacterium]
MGAHATPGDPRRDRTRRLNLAFVLLASIGLVVSSCEGTRSADRMRGGDPGDPLARLVGTSPERMREILGPPAFARTDGPAEMWRYDGDECFLTVFFYREQGALRVNHVEARARSAAPGQQVAASVTPGT